MIKPQKFASRLGFIQKVSSKVYLKRFDLVEPKEISFLPGQTIMFQVAAGVNRSMSIASPPSEKTSITVAHDVSPMGPYSQWTLAARVGDEMHFIGPLGMFTLDRESPRKKVFIATGTGVSPFRAMLLDQLSAISRQSSAKLKAESGELMALYWGLRREEDVFWKEEFEALAGKHLNFKFVLTLSQPSETWLGKKGRVGDHVFVEEKNLMDCDFYLCGSKEMVVDMTQQLLAKNVPKERIKSERFY